MSAGRSNRKEEGADKAAFPPGTGVVRSDLQPRLFLSTIDEQAPELARRFALGLELADFCYAPGLEEAAVRKRAAGRAKGISHFWLHAPFAELFPCAVDPLIREVAVKRYRQTLALARQLGITRLVIHGGYIPQVYFPQWYVGQSVAFWREFLEEAPPDVTLALENVMEPSPDMLVQIVRQVDDPRLRLCFDAGHANTCVSRTPPIEWIGQMRPWLSHIHLHNNEGGADLHAPLGKGSIPMEDLLDTLLEQCPQATFTLENRDCGASLRWLADRGYLEE